MRLPGAIEREPAGCRGNATNASSKTYWKACSKRLGSSRLSGQKQTSKEGKRAVWVHQILSFQVGLEFPASVAGFPFGSSGCPQAIRHYLVAVLP